MTRTAGRLLMAIGVIHVFFGAWLGRGPLLDIARNGFFDAVDADRDRRLLFWFIAFGVPVYLLGLLLSWVGSRGEHVPAWLGWSLCAFALIGAFLMPVSGFWLILVPGIFCLVGSRSQRARLPTRPVD